MTQFIINRANYPQVTPQPDTGPFLFQMNSPSEGMSGCYLFKHLDSMNISYCEQETIGVFQFNFN